MVGLYLALAWGVSLAGCSAPDDTLELLPTLAPTQEADLVLPEASTDEASFSDVSVHAAAMRPGYEGDLDAFAGATRYWLDVDISSPPYSIVGYEGVRYVNASADTLEEVVFRLYPNFLAGQEVLLVSSVAVDGTPAEPVYSVNDTVMTVPLPRPLPPGETADITLVFGLTVARDEVTDTYGRLGDLMDVLSLPSFFPLLSVYDAGGGGWWRERPSLQGDPVYSESALFEVHLTVPSEVVVATVGQTLSQSDNGDGTMDYHVVTGPVRDFAVYISEDYELLSESQDGVTVNVFSLPGAEEGDAFALTATQQALDVFNREFGEYPFAELDVVETGTLAGGIEYPGLFVVTNAVWDQEDPFFETVIAHEAAHQWWYSVVGNDQVGQPWLDESMAQYAVEVYLREAVGSGFAQGTQAYYAGSVETYLEDGGEDMPVGLPVSAYSPQTYRLFVYLKGPLFFDLLEETYGQEAMSEFLHTYFDTFKYGVATTADLQRTAEEVFGEDLDSLFAEWVTE